MWVMDMSSWCSPCWSCCSGQLLWAEPLASWRQQRKIQINKHTNFDFFPFLSKFTSLFSSWTQWPSLKVPATVLLLKILHKQRCNSLLLLLFYYSFSCTDLFSWCSLILLLLLLLLNSEADLLFQVNVDGLLAGPVLFGAFPPIWILLVACAIWK